MRDFLLQLYGNDFLKTLEISFTIETNASLRQNTFENRIRVK